MRHHKRKSVPPIKIDRFNGAFAHELHIRQKSCCQTTSNVVATLESRRQEDQCRRHFCVKLRSIVMCWELDAASDDGEESGRSHYWWAALPPRISLWTDYGGATTLIRLWVNLRIHHQTPQRSCLQCPAQIEQTSNQIEDEWQ
jgi:hypothetical protein